MRGGLAGLRGPSRQSHSPWMEEYPGAGDCRGPDPIGGQSAAPLVHGGRRFQETSRHPGPVAVVELEDKVLVVTCINSDDPAALSLFETVVSSIDLEAAP